MQDREFIDFKQTRDTDQKIHEPCACFESLAYPVFNQSSGGSFPSYAGICLLEFFSPFINPMALPRWWAPIRVKQLSVAATARVIWLWAFVRYWPGHGLAYVSPLL